MLLRADFAVSVKEQELALLTGLKRAAFIIRSRQSLGKSSRIRMNVSRRLEERGRIAVDGHKRGLMADSRLALPTLRRLVRLHFRAVHC